MHNIVVAIDDSEYSLNAVEFGQRLASQLGIEVKAISVVPEQDAVASRRATLKTRFEDTLPLWSLMTLTAAFATLGNTSTNSFLNIRIIFSDMIQR